VKRSVIARNEETKQSNNFNWFLMVRLLPPDQVRGRNDILEDFLRDYQSCIYFRSRVADSHFELPRFIQLIPLVPLDSHFQNVTH